MGYFLILSVIPVLFLLQPTSLILQNQLIKKDKIESGLQVVLKTALAE